MLAESVDVGFAGQIGPQAHVLLFEDEWHSGSVEENLVIVLAFDSEGERLLNHIELESNIGSGGRNLVVVGAWEDFFMDLENLNSRVIDLDMKTLVYTVLVKLKSRGGRWQHTGLVFHDQLEVLDVIAVDVAGRAS